LGLIADRIHKQMGDGESHVLILPDGQGHLPDHWTGRWPLRHGHQWVQQHDWQRPLRGDWLMRLEETVLDLSGPIVLVAHGLGCHLATAWAAYSRQASRVRGALLVAPLDLLSEPWLSRLPSWNKVPCQRLPFPSTVVGQDQGGRSVSEHSGQWARDWGSRWLERPPVSDFSHGPDADWPEGHALLQELIKDKTWSPKNPKASVAA
jgi:predicted alpha/beta hydrolase family esterase